MSEAVKRTAESTKSALFSVLALLRALTLQLRIAMLLFLRRLLYTVCRRSSFSARMTHLPKNPNRFLMQCSRLRWYARGEERIPTQQEREVVGIWHFLVLILATCDAQYMGCTRLKHSECHSCRFSWMYYRNVSYIAIPSTMHCLNAVRFST